MSESLMDSNDLAAFLGCAQLHIYDLVQRGMPHRRLGPGTRAPYRFVLTEVLAWLDRFHGGGIRGESQAQGDGVYEATYLR